MDCRRLRRRTVVGRSYVDAFLRRLRPQTAGGLWLEHVRVIAGVRVNATGKRFAGGPSKGGWSTATDPSHFDYWYAYFHVSKFFIFSLVESITTYFVAFILIALRSSLGGFATLMVSIVSWFDAHRTKGHRHVANRLFRRRAVRAICDDGIGSLWLALHGLVFSLILIVGLPLVSLVRHRPEDYGEVPDGIRTKTGDMNDDTELSPWPAGQIRSA